MTEYEFLLARRDLGPRPSAVYAAARHVWECRWRSICVQRWGESSINLAQKMTAKVMGNVMRGRPMVGYLGRRVAMG